MFVFAASVLHLKSTCFACFLGNAKAFFFLACCQAASIGDRCRSTLSRHAGTVDFHGMACVTCILGGPAWSNMFRCPSCHCVSFLIGTWTCSRRWTMRLSILSHVSVSRGNVLQRLLAILVASNLFPLSHIMDMMSVQDLSNRWPKRCWLNFKQPSQQPPCRLVP